MPPKNHQRLTREELYNLIWAKPMTEIGQAFQVSDRAIAKMCVRKQVPVPPRGYWAKKGAGRAALKPLLPELAKRHLPERKDRITPAGLTSEHPKPSSVFEERKQTIKKALKDFRKPLSEAVDYMVRIEKWRCDYSFGLNASYDPLHPDTGISFLRELPFSEHRDLHFWGVFLEPTRLRQRRFEAHFSRHPRLNETAIEEYLHRYEESPPKSVGAFLKHNQCIAAFLSIPEDAFVLVLQNVAAGKIKFMTLRGQKLRYGHGAIYHYHLEEEQDE